MYKNSKEMMTWEILDPCSVASPDFLRSVVLFMVHRERIDRHHGL